MCAILLKIFTVTFISRLLFMKDKTKTQKCAEFFSHTKLCAGKKIFSDNYKLLHSTA